MTGERDGVVAGWTRTLFEGGTAIGMDDGGLLDRFLATRNEAAFAALVARHGPMVLGVCRGASRDEQDAQDAFQATFLVLARRAGTIRRRASLPSWLHGVARKIALRARADATRRRRKEGQAATRATAEVCLGRAAEDHAALHEEIARLPETYREPIILCYLDGMTYEAAARHLDCPLGTLSVRLKRARERLRSSLTRRGLAIPAGLLGASLAPELAAAAVPAALARLTIRSALISAGTEVAGGGVVPATVTSMAGRMIFMMRFKMAAVGLMVLAGVVVAGTGALAMKPAVAPPAAPPQAGRAPVIEPRSWVRTFANGTTVELIGISTHPSTAGSWRTLEGLPLAKPPYHHAAYTTSTRQDLEVWEVAFRVRTNEKDELVQLQAVPQTEPSNSSPALDSKGLPIPGVRSQSLVCPKDQASCALRCGLTAGSWKTEVTSEGRHSSGIASEKLGVVFGTALESDGRTLISISRDHSADDLRVVAVDLRGHEHRPNRYQSTGVDRFSQMELRFDLPLAEIVEFRLQSRPYQWMTFDDVRLPPRGEAGLPNP